MVAVIDPASYIVQFQNQTGLQKLGDISGRPCYEAIAGSPTPCAFCKMPEAMGTGLVTVNEVLLPNKQCLLVQWSRATTEDGRIHIIETITDVTVQKRMEEAARQAEKMEALSRLAGGLAHDFNNLLTVIRGASEQVTHKLDDPGSSFVPIRQIQSAVSRATELTKRLVAFSHHQLIQPALLDLNGVLAESEARIRAMVGEGIVLELDPHDDPTPVVADRQQVEQIIAVLVSNACEAMPNGGHLTIATAVDMLDETAAERQAVRPGTYVRFVVRDTGLGIAPEVQAHLFEPFYARTGEETGRGLGLASVYGIVRQNGGCIEVTSSHERGTVFTVRLPRSERMEPSLPVRAAVAFPSDGNQRILLVEDDEDVRMAVRDMLATAGYHVQEASDGVDAFERFQSMAAPPHLVLTDVMMPRMTGPQLASEIQAMDSGVRVLYMSGYSDQILEPLAGRRVSFIAKPFGASDLLRAVRKILADE
jgi:signal transduction histidine kinase